MANGVLEFRIALFVCLFVCFGWFAGLRVLFWGGLFCFSFYVFIKRREREREMARILKISHQLIYELKIFLAVG